MIEIKGIKTKVFHGYLTYTPKSCPNCKCINHDHNDIIKWNCKRICKIKITKARNYNTILLLDKQRFFCKHCNKTILNNSNHYNCYNYKILPFSHLIYEVKSILMAY